MADNIKYRFIQNVGDYFPSGYFGDDFLEKVQKCAGLSNEEVKGLCSPFVRLQHDYDEYKNFVINQNPRVEDAIKKTHDFNTQLLKILGYETTYAYLEHCIVNEDADPIEMIPVRHILRQGQQVKMFVMEMQNLIAIDDREPAGLFEQQYESEPDRNTKQQKYSAKQWRFVFELDKDKYKISPAIINKAITQIFLLPEERRPHFILMLAGNVVFLFDKDKWAKGSYLEFSLDELFAQARVSAFRNYYALFHMLVSKQTLAADGEMVLMDTIIEESYKNAYEVTKDLKEGVIFAVETLANEALYYMREVAKRPFGKYDKESDTYDETDDDFEAEVKDDCLTIIYRLLFLFYAESREELEILPVGDEVYKRGYSLESLRDLEMVRLNSQESRDGYFFDESIHRLFSLLSDGHNSSLSGYYKSFRVRPIDSPLFNDKNLHHLGEVRIRNIKWQEIIKALSLSKKKNYCGRISYANLGVNQLGSVYESLLAYRGFYAEEDYIEVHKANEPQDGTFLVPYSRMGDFDISEVLCNPETGEPIILPKGTFVYRLNGRDRQKSASYYTPEVLTRSTVKYTLKSILEKVEKNIDDYRDLKEKGDTSGWKSGALQLLELKILEPAMGAAAFQNEVINQVSEAYLKYRSEELRVMGREKWRIEPDRYRDELQKVKAYIATHNVYGVDLNPTAIELGKLSLWLNVIHKDMETPFFSNRLAVGNAVIGAWLKVYSRSEVVGKVKPGKRGTIGQKLLPTAWWESAPHKVSFSSTKVNRKKEEVYHFLLPDPSMLGVRNIKEQKAEYPNEFIRMKNLIADWIAPISGSESERLITLSQKIDILLKEYCEFQCSIEQLTQNRVELWGVPSKGVDIILTDNYAEKQKLNDTRYRHDNAYHRLKMVMDYWCALWFWEYSDASSLPTREQYWSDINAMLNVPDELLNKATAKAMKVHVDNKGQLNLWNTSNGMDDMFMQAEYEERMKNVEDNPYGATTEEESELKTLTKEQILTEVQGKANDLFENSYRYQVVARLSERYRFFHPMLEFLEVFWLRDGFDIICGNPPWIKLEFDEIGIISEKYPEVAIRKISAPDVRRKRDDLFLSDTQLEDIYRTEEINNICSGVFLNAFQNYHLLIGQQTNLYKCILANGFGLLSKSGQMGLLHPETVYDDSNGQPLREEMYKRLDYHFQFQNALNLFAEVAHREKYGSNIYGGVKENISFDSINNLFHPSTIDSCYIHDGHGDCGGIKIDGEWNVSGHKDRIVHYDEFGLRVLCETFEENGDWQSTKLVSIHAKEILNVLKSLSSFHTHVRDFPCILSEGWHETNDVDKGIIKRDTQYPNYANLQMIYSGPHIFVGNPFYKTPRKICVGKADYDIVHLNCIDSNYISRTNYIPCISISEYKKSIQGFVIGQDNDGNEIYSDWIDYYKSAFRLMLSQAGERTLSGGIIPPLSSHICTVISAIFKEKLLLTEFTGLTSSLVLDFFVKTIGTGALHGGRILSFPLGISNKYKSALFVRTLMLNSLTKHYTELWEYMWKEEYKEATWSIVDNRLKPFSSLTEQWQWSTPLRNYFERRQALVEIDVISAMALGLNLQDLEMIYTIQFPVLQQNENDTWYDAEGKIVFTCSKGLTGVGLDRKYNSKTGMLGWEDIRGEQLDENTYAGTSPTHTHTIDPTKSELYGGQKQTFVAPYNRCDRIVDYRRAWEHFEKIFNN